jgi:DNA-binding LacI/PurR family transcriptional regulator
MHRVSEYEGAKRTLRQVVLDRLHTKLSGERPIRATVRQREAMGYKPNQAARFLANRRSTLIALITDDPGIYGPAHAILSLEQQARLHGYTLTTKMIIGRQEAYATLVHPWTIH